MIAASLMVAPGLLATTFEWMSARAFLEQSDLIAVVDVASVHEVTTPDGFRLQSARARVLQTVFRRFPDFPEQEKAPLVVYSLDPNAATANDIPSGSGFHFPIQEGRAFVCLKMKGFNKFHPYTPLSFQRVDKSGTIRWPTATVLRAGMQPYSPTPVAKVIRQLEQLQTEKQTP